MSTIFQESIGDALQVNESTRKKVQAPLADSEALAGSVVKGERKILTSTFTIAEAIAKVVAFKRSLTSTFTFQETLAKVVTYHLSLASSISISALGLIRGFFLVSTFSLAGTITKIVTGKKLVSSISFTASNVKTIHHFITDNITFRDYDRIPNKGRWAMVKMASACHGGF